MPITSLVQGEVDIRTPTPTAYDTPSCPLPSVTGGIRSERYLMWSFPVFNVLHAHLGGVVSIHSRVHETWQYNVRPSFQEGRGANAQILALVVHNGANEKAGVLNLSYALFINDLPLSNRSLSGRTPTDHQRFHCIS